MRAPNKMGSPLAPRVADSSPSPQGEGWGEGDRDGRQTESFIATSWQSTETAEEALVAHISALPDYASPPNAPRRIVWVALLMGATILFAPLCQAKAPKVEHVLVIGCDGFGAVGFTPSNTPVLHRLMREGAYTLHARGVMPTVSSPNWASMIMGAGP